jgi:hypothetical protein
VKSEKGEVREGEDKQGREDKRQKSNFKFQNSKPRTDNMQLNINELKYNVNYFK